jgi:hypothetical protein
MSTVHKPERGYILVSCGQKDTAKQQLELYHVMALRF